MSLGNNKKKVSQNDLRRVMNEHKKKLSTVQRIESPIAKYTDSGQLMCILCKSLVRNETVWNIHLNSKTHKENIALAKKGQIEPSSKPEKPSVSLKRPTSPATVEAASKKVKGILKNSTSQAALPSDFFDKPNSASSVAKNVKEIQKDASNETAETNDVEMEEKKDDKDQTNQAPLPEGFFDDPIMDAKARNVEYKDPIEEEWEKFQKEIKEEAAQSAQIIADDQEEATTERQLDEIEEQMRHWSRVVELERRKEQMSEQVERKIAMVTEDLSSADEDEFDEFLDWRAKKSYK